MNIIAICDKDTAIGLRLAGILDVRIPESNEHSPIQLWNQIEEESTNIGLILITEKIAETIGKQLTEFRIHHLLPIIVEIPDKHGRKIDHVDYVSHLIKKAVGMEIKIVTLQIVKTCLRLGLAPYRLCGSKSNNQKYRQDENTSLFLHFFLHV